MKKQTIGFIGLGNMGLPMAANLAQAGYAVQAFDAAPGPLALAAGLAGVTAVHSPAEAAQGAQVLFTVLPNDAIVREVYLGDAGVAQGGAAGLITCDCSTVSPEATAEVHSALQAKGLRHMDTPMLGSTPQAQSGEIFFIVAGEAAALPVISPLLEVMGKLHMHVGPSGTANRIKLIHNVLGAANSAAVAESLALCTAVGVDARAYFEVVAGGGGMAYTTYFGKRVERILSGDYSPTFTLRLMHKDVSLAMDLGKEARTALPIMEETLRNYTEGLENRWGDEDFSAVTRVIEKRLGRKIGT